MTRIFSIIFTAVINTKLSYKIIGTSGMPYGLDTTHAHTQKTAQKQYSSCLSSIDKLLNTQVTTVRKCVRHTIHMYDLKSLCTKNAFPSCFHLRNLAMLVPTDGINRNLMKYP